MAAKPQQRQRSPLPDRVLVEEIEALVEVPQWSVAKARAVYDQLRPYSEPKKGERNGQHVRRGR